METIALSCLLIFILLFGGMIFPVWAIVSCVTSENRTKKSKAIWLIVMLLIWPMGSWIYGLFASQRRLFKIFSIILIVGMISVEFFQYNPVIHRYLSIFYTKNLTISDVEHMDLSQLSVQEQANLKTALIQVLTDRSKGFKDFKKFYRGSYLMSLLKYTSSDAIISSLEYREWMKKFEKYYVDLNY